MVESTSFAERCLQTTSFWMTGIRSILRSTASSPRTSPPPRSPTKPTTSRLFQPTLEMFVCASFQYSTLLFTGRFGSFFCSRKTNISLSVTGLLRWNWRHFYPDCSLVCHCRGRDYTGRLKKGDLVYFCNKQITNFLI